MRGYSTPCGHRIFNSTYRYKGNLTSSPAGPEIRRMLLQIHSACLANRYRKIPFNDLTYSVFSPCTYRFFSHILSITTDSFPVAGECAQMISNTRNGIIFFTAFKGILPQKTVCMWATGPRTHKL